MSEGLAFVKESLDVTLVPVWDESRCGEPGYCISLTAQGGAEFRRSFAAKAKAKIGKALSRREGFLPYL